MPKQRLTDRQLISGVTLTDLLHFVVTGDTSQNPAGSSYKGNVEQLFGAFSAYTCSNPLTVDVVNACTSGITINGNVVINGSATTINTEVIQSKDNNIVLNYSGTHLTAIGGGITLEDGVSDGVDSRIFTNSDGIWLFDPGLSASTGTIDTLSACTGVYTSNLYGCSPITVHDTIESVTGIIRTSGGTGAELNLKDSFGPNGTWSITSDNGGYGIDSAWLYGQPSNGSQLAYQVTGSEAIGISVFAGGITTNLENGKEILITDNTDGSVNSGNIDKRSVFVGTRNSTMLSGVTNSVVIGGVGLSATQDDTVYVDNLNINTIGSGTSVINLGLDSSGNVVTGTTGSVSDIFVTGGTFDNNTDTITFTNTSGGTFDVTGVTDTFTGNTSGDCITDLYVTNLYGCSPLHIDPSGLNNVYIVENGGNVGIGTTATTVTLDVAGETRLSGSGQNVLTVIGSGDTQPLFKVEGSSGELFSITDSLVGSLFSVNDISGLPILEVFDDDTVHMGSYQAPSLNTTVLLNPSTGLSTVYSIPMSAYTGAWFEYTVSNTGGARAGQIMSIFSGNTVNFTETTTTDIGSTSDVTFSMSADSTNTLLQVSATTSGWEVKTIVRSI